MTKVYRTVPSFSAMVNSRYNLNEENCSLEGELYQLGITSFEIDNVFFSRSREEVINTFLSNNEYNKFFFLSPIDAIRRTSRVNLELYPIFVFELLEYDIPDEILLDSCGCGFYSGKPVIEFCIPESVFSNENPTVVDEERIRESLNNTYLNYIQTNNEKADIPKLNEAISTLMEAQRQIHLGKYITGNRCIIDQFDLFEKDNQGSIVGYLSNDDLSVYLESKNIKCNQKVLSVCEDISKESDYTSSFVSKESKYKKIRLTLESLFNSLSKEIDDNQKLSYTNSDSNN